MVGLLPEAFQKTIEGALFDSFHYLIPYYLTLFGIDFNLKINFLIPCYLIFI